MYEKVSDPADPRRCQTVTAYGQCLMIAVEGQQYCHVHARALNHAVEKEAVKNYRLQRWQQRVSEFAENDQVKSLREEIGITRMLLEEMFGFCTNSTELLLYSGRIADLVMKIEKLVVSCHRLEERTGLLLDKQAVVHLASSIVAIIGHEISDADVLERIAGEIAGVILKQSMEKGEL